MWGETKKKEKKEEGEEQDKSRETEWRASVAQRRTIVFRDETLDSVGGTGNLGRGKIKV
jgi:hypothetical protein